MSGKSDGGHTVRPLSFYALVQCSSFTCPVSDPQNLEAAVMLDGTGYRVLRWRTVPAQEWQTDETLDIWDGAMF